MNDINNHIDEFLSNMSYSVFEKIKGQYPDVGLYELIESQVWNQVGDQVWDQVRSQVGSQVRSQFQ
jgi:hypothetical protein